MGALSNDATNISNHNSSPNKTIGCVAEIIDDPTEWIFPEINKSMLFNGISNDIQTLACIDSWYGHQFKIGDRGTIIWVGKHPGSSAGIKKYQNFNVYILEIDGYYVPIGEPGIRIVSQKRNVEKSIPKNSSSELQKHSSYQSTYVPNTINILSISPPENSIIDRNTLLKVKIEYCVGRNKFYDMGYKIMLNISQKSGHGSYYCIKDTILSHLETHNIINFELPFSKLWSDNLGSSGEPYFKFISNPLEIVFYFLQNKNGALGTDELIATSKEIFYTLKDIPYTSP